MSEVAPQEIQIVRTRHRRRSPYAIFFTDRAAFQTYRNAGVLSAQSIAACPRPVIAAVEGGAAGACMSLAFACDMQVTTS